MDVGSVEQRASGIQQKTCARLAQRVVEYYDSTQVLYSHIWSSTALHYGFWERGTRTRQEAVRNVDRLVARELGVPMGSRVLDAGCGIGGTATFLAEELHHDVLGITLSQEQLRRARASAASCRAPIVPRYEVRDFLATGLDDASFDGVFGIESICHAERKSDFLREAFRLLRPGGRLVVSDGFLTCDPVGQARKDYQCFVDGLALVNLATLEEFRADLVNVGFTEIRCTDKRTEILRSARSIARLSTLGVLVCWLPCRMGLFPSTWLGHGLAGMSQRRVFESGVFTYCVFSATKPKPL